MSSLPRRLAVLGTAVGLLVVSIYLAVSGAIGSEFLPHLDEGAIWVRGTLCAEHRTGRRRAHHETGAADACQFSRGDEGRQPGWPAR